MKIFVVYQCHDYHCDDILFFDNEDAAKKYCKINNFGKTYSWEKVDYYEAVLMKGCSDHGEAY